MLVLSDPSLWASLVTLTAMEIVLGIDNLVFLSILANRLPETQRAKARAIGLSLALVLRLGLLLSIAWIMRLTEPIFGGALAWLSWRDVILFAGGLFLLYKGTTEIHETIEGDEHEAETGRPPARFWTTIVQIGLLDIVFSLDSVITAVGMANQVPVMVAAIVIAMGVMLAGASAVSSFIHRHPTVRMLALSFLLLIGMTLVADGFGVHVPKGYIYAAMAFSAAVEALNYARRRKTAR
ncbi:TerC family protein [Rhodopila sp.]|uniref:TerC family protein n=1 Tax=Rhodopila sp. TaxID=2480087 RepID=UPI002CE62824|nr:TerC family protein [Rhodopila sp.]HVZ08937.1 TerC family protein [Rhodopila sp.]